MTTATLLDPSELKKATRSSAPKRCEKKYKLTKTEWMAIAKKDEPENEREARNKGSFRSGVLTFFSLCLLLNFCKFLWEKSLRDTVCLPRMVWDHQRPGERNRQLF